MADASQPLFAPDAQPNFSHPPLPIENPAIRLLDIHAGGGSDPLKATLRSVELDTHPCFEALSYMWGPVEPTRTIEVNHQQFILRPNIHSFLLRLRWSDASRTVWLDSVCINQNDTAESSAQVALMRDIYTSCDRCLVWLGEALNREDEVINVFNDTPVDSSGMADLNSLIRLLYRDGLWQAYKDVLTNAYWSRVWMLQETTLPRNVLVMCGPASCKLDNVPTQIRGRMFEILLQRRVQYPWWLKIFQDFDSAPNTISITDMGSRTDGDWKQLKHFHPIALAPQGMSPPFPVSLGFRRNQDRKRWYPVALQTSDHSDILFSSQPNAWSDLTLSNASTLSFAKENFDCVLAFRTIQAMFWSIFGTRSERLLEQRRQYGSNVDQAFASTQFRAYLETADQWFCTDIRDRLFGATGVFQKWPRSYPFPVDYNLSPRQLLFALIDYCRATDPFKLAIRLAVALQIQISFDKAYRDSSGDDVTLVSRIDWPGSAFPFRRLYRSMQHVHEAVWRLQEVDIQQSVSMTVLLRSSADRPRQSDVLISIGDSLHVLLVRENENGQSWNCVGIGVNTKDVPSGEREMSDADPTARPQHPPDLLMVSSLRDLLLEYHCPKIVKAKSTETSEDGTPVLWWITLSVDLFWQICNHEYLRRRSGDSHETANNADSDIDSRAATGLPDDLMSPVLSDLAQMQPDDERSSIEEPPLLDGDD